LGCCGVISERLGVWRRRGDDGWKGGLDVKCEGGGGEAGGRGGDLDVAGGLRLGGAIRRVIGLIV
jgi:hypothetical protein